jgi:DNA-binding HxlR family transcriptional regulator
MATDWTCPVARAARVLGDTCVLLVLRDLAQGPRHFGELLGSACGNTRTLSARLKRLTDLGLVARTPEGGRPPRVRYSLTPMGYQLLPAVDVLRAFGERWLPSGCDPLAAEGTAAGPGGGTAPAAAQRTGT